MNAAAPRILLIDDEVEIRRFLTLELERNGYSVETAENGTEAQRILRGKPPDIVLLDLGLPDMDGKAIIAAIRATSMLPIIVLSARHNEDEKVTVLDMGADDYLTKPFGRGELIARIRVALRRRGEGDAAYVPYQYQGLYLDLEKRVVRLHGAELRLTPTEYRLLAALAARPGSVVTQATLISSVWGTNSQGNNHYLRIYVQHLRDKLGDDPLKPTFIMTEAGVGYRLASDQISDLATGEES